MTMNQDLLLGLLGIPIGAYFLWDVKRIGKRGWYMKKDFRTYVTEFDEPKLFAWNQRVGLFLALLFLGVGVYCFWRLLPSMF